MSTPWNDAARSFRADLSAAVATDELRPLHRVSAWRHALTLLRQLAFLALAVWAILAYGALWYVWIPASVVIGFVVFDFTVLVHEAVHEVILPNRSKKLHTLLGHLYALPSGLSFSQFRRWHLDHHKNLGTEDADPKRHYLTPKIVTRSFKLLYLTPALFPIYFRAARRAAEGYDPGLKRRIARERSAAILFHLAVPALLWSQLGWVAALKLHVLPVFFVFPVAFTINRLGQHYDIDPADPAHWGTVLRPSPLLWDRIYLWSNYHIEHHYFPGVPMYHLPALHKALRPFFKERGMQARTYTGLLFDWLVRNRAPHTNWSAPKPEQHA